MFMALVFLRIFSLQLYFGMITSYLQFNLINWQISPNLDYKLNLRTVSLKMNKHKLLSHTILFVLLLNSNFSYGIIGYFTVDEARDQTTGARLSGEEKMIIVLCL